MYKTLIHIVVKGTSVCECVVEKEREEVLVLSG